MRTADDRWVAANFRLLIEMSRQLKRRTAQLCRDVKAAGKLVTDAQHAAIAIAAGCTWVTRDQDFARFVPHDLEWRHLVL